MDDERINRAIWCSARKKALSADAGVPGMTGDREKIAKWLLANISSGCGFEGMTFGEASDRLLALLSPKMLTPEEAKELTHCFIRASNDVVGSVNWQAPVYLKLRRIAEG